MVLIREFEDGVKFLFLEGTMPGTIHQCQGQEATAVGVCSALSRMTSSRRRSAVTGMRWPRDSPSRNCWMSCLALSPAAAKGKGAACMWGT